jgi:DNA-binding winged helix-turn-helix (wHTH) protein/Flp pilus assembly protein TadD
MSKDNKELYEFGDFRLDVRERRLSSPEGAKNGSLPEKSFQTLVHLVRNSGRLITKEELLSSVWPDTIVEENNLGKAIHSIRNYLGDSSAEPKYIETVPKYGYRFVAEVKRIGDSNGSAPILSASGAHAMVSLDEWERREATESKTEPVTSDLSAASSSRNAKIFGIAAPLVVILALVVGWLAWGRQGVNLVEGPSNATSPDSHRAAYDSYVRGKVKVANENREDTEAAIALLQEAVSLNPNLAEAHAQLARAHNTMAFKFTEGEERRQHHEDAEVAIEKALKLNPELAEAHFARGLILWSNTNRFPHKQSISAYKRSLAIDPNSDETHHQLSLVYSHIGLEDQALASVRKALELNPNNTLARFRIGVYLQYQGKFDEAIDLFKTIPREHTPLLVDRTLAETLIQLGKLQEAEAIADDYLQRFPQDEGGSFTSVKALILAKNRKYEDAEAMIRKAQDIGAGFGHFHHTAYNIASAYTAMNRPDDAVRWLESTADSGFPNYPYFSLDPNLKNLRDHHGFRAFMAKLRPQWERFKQIVQ